MRGYLDGAGWEDGFLRPAELEFGRVAFDHPLWVLYSSGTTGLPKAIVHGQGGSCSSTSSARACTWTRVRATGSSGSPRRAG